MTDERLGHQPTARGSDDPLHREIRRLLAVDPSPAFEASVRARVADEPAPAVWRSDRLWAAFGTAAALVLAVAGGELISSLPYVLSLTSDRDQGSLRMGAEVPVLTMVQPATPDGAPVPGLEGGAFSYRPVGTRIDSSSTG